MLDSLEELRVQRKLIQKHLDWLDAQIDQAASVDRTCDSTVKKEPFENAQTQEFEEGELLKKNTDISNSCTLDGKIASSGNGEAILSSETLDTKQIRFGCIAFFAMITLLFLFLLFVLPYLIV